MLAHSFAKPVIPKARNPDIEFASAPLIDRLDSRTGDRPLSTYPKDVAMQGHRFSFSPLKHDRIAIAL
jgi:hypothetical protein